MDQQYARGPYPPGILLPGAAYPAAAGPWGYPDVFREEQQSLADARRLQAFYPRIAQKIQQQAEEACDKMEYEGSMMFDEYPDRLMMRRITEDIAARVKETEPELAMEPAPETALPGQKTETAGPALKAMQSGGRRPSRRRDDWLNDLVQVILVDEMHRRRCRHRRCRQRRFW